ncbi:MAG: hypothetical protein WCB36_13415, partial [Burkholderiales bacterium]
MSIFAGAYARFDDAGMVNQPGGRSLDKHRCVNYKELRLFCFARFERAAWREGQRPLPTTKGHSDLNTPDTDKVFAGSVPKLYEYYMVPLIFEPYALDLAGRLAM